VGLTLVFFVNIVNLIGFLVFHSFRDLKIIVYTIFSYNEEIAELKFSCKGGGDDFSPRNDEAAEEKTTSL